MSQEKVSSNQLLRLERLTDVIFALVIWRIFMILPRPNFDNPEWDSVADMLVSEWASFVVPALAILIVIVYWVQSNALLGRLKATDAIHTGITIFQVFFVLFYLYALSLGIGLGSNVDTRELESSAAVLIGVTAYLGWWYAGRKGNLLADDVSDKEAKDIGTANLAEPLTAALTIPAAFIGPWAWELSWFLYPFLKWLFSRFSHERKKGSPD
jgi:uncharacterized membrane protein